MGSRGTRTIDDSLFDALRTRFTKHTEAVLSALTTRSRDRLKGLGSTIEARKRKEIDEMTQLLDDLAKNLEAELTKEEGCRRSTSRYRAPSSTWRGPQRPSY